MIVPDVGCLAANPAKAARSGYTPAEVARHVCNHLRDPRGVDLCLNFWTDQITMYSKRYGASWHLADVPLTTLTFPRRACDHPEIASYVAKRLAGSPFPAIVLRQSSSRDPGGARWIVWDGGHRAQAATCVGDDSIAAFVPVRP